MTAQLAPRQAIRRLNLVGLGTLALLVVGAGGWSAATSLSGAVIAPGSVVVESNVKKVQHPSGGVVREILVREGARVAVGDVVVRLDDTQARARLAIVTKSLDELAARRARLIAERDGRTTVEFPQQLEWRAADAAVRDIQASETRLFELRRTARAGRQAQLGRRIAGFDEEIDGLAIQADAKQRETELTNDQLDGVRGLWEKELVQKSAMTVLQRDVARLQGERGQLMAAIAEAREKITETELQILQVDQDLRSEVATELREIEGKVAGLEEQRISMEDQLRRLDVRAPQSGIVQELAIHTIGGVVASGDALMLIVPQDDELTVEARVSPNDIDQLSIGQPAALRFSAFNRGNTPEIIGALTHISADVSNDTRTGQSHYTIRIAMPPAEIERLGDVRIVPGMPVEAFIETESRTVASFFLKPMADRVRRAFRDQ